ncbi:MAG: hypothetical protein HRU12_03155, partial [Phaeodactylibacter sp.]|nr:hypothetical protein [Phaeodactylibacter sp.]
MKMRIITPIILLLIAGAVQAQYTVIGSLDSTFTPTELIQDVCLGEGIEVTNIEFEGINQSVGRFLGASEVIGMDQGFVMTTGLAQTSGNFGGADLASIGDASFINNSNAYTEEIATISTNSNVRDVAIFRINFVPTGDTLMFRYVFASDEYPTFVCSNFNDVFGFFLEGEDPETGDQAIRNLAKIPGTDLPVSINSINNGVPGSYPGGNSLFCSEDFNGSLDFANLFNQVPPFIAPTYNGFTDILVAKANVVPCQEYQMTLVIADIGDAWWDSGIFFEANSFCSFSGSHGATEQYSITETCAPQSFEIDLSAFPEEEYPVSYTITGSAEAGSDYADIPLSGAIEEPLDIWAFPLAIEDDELEEGTEQIRIEIKGTTCREKVIVLNIFDPIAIEGPEDTAGCSGEPVTLTASSDSLLLENMTFTWSNGSTAPSIEVNPTTTTTYTVAYSNGISTCEEEITVTVGVLESEISATINEGESYEFGGADLTAAGVYENTISATNGCDSLIRLSLSVNPQTETMTDSLAEGEEAQACLNTAIFQTVESITEIGAGFEHVEIEADIETSCVNYIGISQGVDTLAFLSCGDTGLCDTTILVLSVFTNLLDAVDDYDTTAYNQSKAIEVLANDWTSSTTITDQYIAFDPLYGTASISVDGTVLYEPDLNTCLQQDEFSYTICNSIGCDTATVFLFLDETEGQCDLVWPGDVGNDGIVNQMDQWAIGLAYGREGIVRANASIDWVGQFALNWPSTITFAYEFNAKYGDCNGDGFITADDMGAIQQNWGLTHPLAPVTPYNFPQKDQPKSLGAPEWQGEQVRIPVYMGTEYKSIWNAYGFSFMVNFTPGSLSEIDFTPAGSFETGQEDPIPVISQIIDEAHAIVSVVRTNQ